jgi:rhodanese-related sulfurtransferase
MHAPICFFCLLLAAAAVAAERPEISPDGLLSKMKGESKPLLLDVRSPQEFSDGHVADAVNIPFNELRDRIAELGDDKAREVVVYCRSGKRAGIAETTLRKLGFTAVLHLTGDMLGWQRDGRPISK